MKDTVILRHKVDRDFTILSNHTLRDQRLSWKATGLISFLLHLPADFTLHLSHLAQRKKDGRDATRAGLQELQNCGYLKIVQERDDSGKFEKTVWTVSDIPFASNGDGPVSGNPKPATPKMEKATLLSTKKHKGLILEKTTTTTHPQWPLECDDEKFQFQKNWLIQKLGIDVKFIDNQFLSIPSETQIDLLCEILSKKLKPGAITTDPKNFLGALARKAMRNEFQLSAGWDIKNQLDQHFNEPKAKADISINANEQYFPSKNYDKFKETILPNLKRF